ncbi:7-alpha-hydroxysteroid dehydrogenase [Poseidonocella pacifica]|uniref:7-alpha-hydroxysteroid dehydrogenase n=1 Tax=Poseidonocella pacifica TaxID=871651 RepID=A0A1I0XJX5_9RHOB|nr:SDR family oxidoreductase [Poseidonocella pacifica]SFB00620.1 7-alpha-hydroxysteroid dehydrogenase [Poseidonocella pacifica]
MSYSIEGRTAIVTGAANGVGLAIGRHFVGQGARVMFADMDEGRLLHELAEWSDDREHVAYFAGDLREKLTIANLLSATLDNFDRVDILINASRQMMSSSCLEGDGETLRTLIDQNVMTAYRLSQAVARRFIKQSNPEDQGSAGSIVNLSSIAARRTHPDLLAYSVSSAALDQLTRSMAVALAPERIRVNSVAFGSVMSQSLRDTLKENSDYREDIEDHTPLSRIANPAEVAGSVQFLCSEAAGFVTGQIMTVDGGRTLLDPVAAPAH